MFLKKNLNHLEKINIFKIFLSFCFLVYAHSVSSQNEKYTFSHLNVNHGLSNNQINTILKDSRGFMWIGTMTGLNRYDGYNVKIFRHDSEDSTSLNDTYINDIFEGPEGTLWVTTRRGMNVYDPLTETFHKDGAILLPKLKVWDYSFSKIIKSSQGDFWFASPYSGLYRYSHSAGRTLFLENNKADSSSVYGSAIADMVEDSENNIWLIYFDGVIEKLDSKTNTVTFRLFDLNRRFNGKRYDYRIVVDADNDLWVFLSNDAKGVFHYSSDEHKFRHFQKGESVVDLNSNIIGDVVEAGNGLIWVGTDHGGINQIDKKDYSVTYIKNSEDKNSISQNSIKCLYKDDNGILWAGTFKAGLNYYHEALNKFPVFKYNPSLEESLQFNDVNCFVEDSLGNLWIGTNGGGLIYFDRKQNTFTQFKHDPYDQKSISNNVVVNLWVDHQGILWIGTYFGGLNSFNGKTFTHYKHDPKNKTSLSHDRVWKIFEDSGKNLWIGTLGGGLDLFSRETASFKNFRQGEVPNFNSNFIADIIEDSKGYLWIASSDGINKYDRKNNTFKFYESEIGNRNSLSINNVNCVYQDSRGLLWFGTREGLNLMDPVNESFQKFYIKDGLPDNYINRILEDDEGFLWISSPNGLSKIEVVSGKGVNNKVALNVKNYDEYEGLQGREFNEKAALKTRKGELVFGGRNGFNLFLPSEIKDNKIIPSVEFVDFQLFNKSIKAGEQVNGRRILTNSISNTEELVLKHFENVFSLEFAALSYFNPEKIRYSYILEGFNTDWVTIDSKNRKAVYTNLNPGRYVFRVKATNSDGYWNEEGASLRITVLPPFWKTEIAYVVYVLLILGALLLSRNLVLERARLHYQFKQERFEAQRMQELNMMKIKFFTNVSHEFRTPLTLIITPLENLLKNIKDQDLHRQLQIMSRNGVRLLRLVNQLLDFRKMEVDEFKFNASRADVVDFIYELAESFSDLSEKKQIEFRINTRLNRLEMLFDQDKLDKIIFNLLSNAFKFTPEQGRVSLELNIREDDDAGNKNQWLEIRVSDTGIGIPPEKHEKIFENFFQYETPGSIVNQGSGIGLSLTKEFVKLHEGKIFVESEPNQGSTFVVLLPLDKAEIEVVSEPIETILPSLDRKVEEIQVDLKNEEEVCSGKFTLLLVEDNDDFRFYLKDNLNSQYGILEASNGKDGWKKALGQLPDLIVSDISMPVMDGLSLCKKIKNDPRTSHIPVILLTARVEEEEKIEGFETGADDYITKPFNFEILQSRIKNLIQIRKTLHKNFNNQIEIVPSEIAITSLDEKLIQKALIIVEKNISNAEFSVEELSHELGMSRVHLYKKLSSLTGKTPIEFIRVIRLKRAIQLLDKSQLSISEVAYEVGFNNPKYFTKYFKTEYGILPSQYLEKAKS